jgi:UDP-glucose 4-epimerase
MRILITGAAGFIGSHIAEAYRRAGHEVGGVDNLATGSRRNLPAGVRFWEANLADEGQLESIFEEFRPEAISHHAAQVNVRVSWEKPLEDARANVLGSLALLHQAVRWGAQKVIYSSSGGAIYGEPDALPATEDHPVRPLSNYGVSKYVTELYLYTFRANGGPEYVILRYPNVYGPRQDPKGEAGVVAIFATQLLRKERPRIYGDGSKTRDYVYIDDIVEANLRALDSSTCGAFNLGWGKEITDFEVFQAVSNTLGSTLEPHYEQKRPGEIDHICLDATRARDTLNWSPRVEFDEGVRRVVEYWKERLASE